MMQYQKNIEVSAFQLKNLASEIKHRRFSVIYSKYRFIAQLFE